MLNTIRPAFALLDRARRPWLVAYVGTTLLVSALEALGLGLVYVFFDVALSPDTLGGLAPVKHLHTALGSPEPRVFLVMLSVIVIVAFVARAVLMLLASWVSLAMRRRVETDLVAKLLRSYFAKPLTWHATHTTSQLLNNIASSIGHVIQHVIIDTLELVGAMLMAVFLLATMAWLRPVETGVLTVVLVAVGGVYLAVSQKYVVAWGRTMIEASEEKWRTVREPLRGIKTIKNMGVEEFFARQVDTAIARFLDVLLRQGMAQAVPRHLLELLLVAGILAVIGSAFAAGAQASEVIPPMVLFATAGMRLLPQATRAIQAIQYIQFSDSALRAIVGDIAEAHETPHASASVSAPTGRRVTFSRLSLHNVSFRYCGATRDAIHGITLELKAGEHVALVGLSGAGKTTLADVLLGLVEPTEGELWIDGERVAFIPREMFAYVPQESFIIRDTLRRNIGLGLEASEIDDERVKRAADGAALGSVIARQPQGLDAPMSEDGANLSGGEKQRLGIARALFRERDCLVLDEPTSALDALTEAEISATIAALRGVKTVVLIAHRLSTIKNFDRIVFLEDGRVSAVGNFGELYETCSHFRTMVDFLSVSHLEDRASEVSTTGIPAL